MQILLLSELVYKSTQSKSENYNLGEKIQVQNFNTVEAYQKTDTGEVLLNLNKGTGSYKRLNLMQKKSQFSLLIIKCKAQSQGVNKSNQI